MIPVLRSLAYIKRYWQLTALAFISLMSATVFSLIVPQILRNVIDQGLPQQTTGPLLSSSSLSYALELGQARPQLIFAAALLLLGLSILRAVVAFGQRYFGERLSQYVSYDIRNDFYNKVQHLPFAYHDQFQMGQIITRAITDVEAIRGFIAQGLIDGISVLLIAIGVIVAMLTLSVPLTLVALLPVPLILLAALRMGWVQIHHWLEIMQHMSGLSNVLEENVIGIQVIRAFNRQQSEADHWARINQQLYRAQVQFTETWSTYFPLMAFLVAISTAIMLWQGGPQVVNHKLSIGTIIALNGYILLLALPVQRLGFVVQQFSSASTSAKRVFEILDTPSVLIEKLNAQTLPPIRGYVRFEDVSLHYGTDSPEVMHHVTFETQPGQVIGLVGSTGSGKTTIVNLIPRFYDVTDGRVTIDGYDVRDVTLQSLRSQIGLVLQESLLFTASIRENIAYGRPDASDDDIIAAATAADAHGFISEMPEGYNTRIGERGTTLSGGQRQRIAIARALLIKPHILILDDATSSVDTETENAIQQALVPLMKDRLTFIIAQRLSSIRDADLVLVIDHGAVVQRGTHDDLITQAGLYQDLYRVQMEEQVRTRVQMQEIERAEALQGTKRQDSH